MEGAEGDVIVNPFPDGHPIVDCYSRYVSTDYDMSIFWCPLCQGVGHFRFTQWCYHILTNHVRYFSACPCDRCIASPLKSYHWIDFLHGKDNIMVIADEEHMENYGCWVRPIIVRKKCPADPHSCSSTFETDGKQQIEAMVLHLIIDHGW